MPGLGTALFQLGLAEQAFPSDKTYVMPGFLVKQGAEQAEMGLSGLMASHVFKPHYRDEPFVKPAPRPRKFDPVKPSGRELTRSYSLPVEISASERRQVFRRRRVQTCDGRIEEEKEIDAEVQEALGLPNFKEPKPQDRLADVETSTSPPDDIPKKPALSKKQRNALKVLHFFGWTLLFPIYLAVFCMREAPDPDDDEDLQDDTCLPFFT